jgi:hypothetical protein
VKTKIFFKRSFGNAKLTEIAEAILSGTGQIELKTVPGGMMMGYFYFVKIYMSREKLKVLLCSNSMRQPSVSHTLPKSATKANCMFH